MSGLNANIFNTTFKVEQIIINYLKQQTLNLPKRYSFSPHVNIGQLPNNTVGCDTEHNGIMHYADGSCYQTI